MFSPLTVCLFICQQDYTKNYIADFCETFSAVVDIFPIFPNNNSRSFKKKIIISCRCTISGKCRPSFWTWRDSDDQVYLYLHRHVTRPGTKNVTEQFVPGRHNEKPKKEATFFPRTPSPSEKRAAE